MGVSRLPLQWLFALQPTSSIVPTAYCVCHIAHNKDSLPMSLPADHRGHHLTGALTVCSRRLRFKVRQTAEQSPPRSIIYITHSGSLAFYLSQTGQGQMPRLVHIPSQACVQGYLRHYREVTTQYVKAASKRNHSVSLNT